MMDRYSEADVLLAVPRLTRTRLTAFIEAEVVVPLQAEAGQVFRQIDIVRMELLCELSDEFDLEADALGVVISLIDQLHAARRDLRAIARAVAAEPPEVRARIGAALARLRAESI